MTRCPNCGHINDRDASFCQKCGANLRASAGMPTSTKILIVVVIILVGLLGVVVGMMFLVNQTAPANNTTVVINQTNPQPTASAEWRQIDSFSGVGNSFRSFNIKGNKFKVVMTATPTYNNATNYMTTEVKSGNSILRTATLSWGPKDPIESKESTLEVTGSPGTYSVAIYTKDLAGWTITIYDYY